MTNDQIVNFAQEISTKHGDFLHNFNQMVVEYKQVAEKAGITNPVEELPGSATFFFQVISILTELEALNG